MHHTERPLLAIAFRAAAMALLSTMFMLIKYVGELGVAGPEIVFWRQAFSVPILFGWLAATGGLHRLRTRRMASHARRATTGMIGLFCNVSAALLLPLAEATTFSFTTPLFAVLMTALVLRDRVGPWRWTAVALGFLGVLIIANPGHEAVSPWGVAAGLGAGLLVAVVSFQIRDLARTEEPISCVFWFAFYGALMTAILLPLYYTPHSAREWAILAGIGTLGTIAQLLITASLRLGQVATVVVMDYTSLIWATFYGWLIWDRLPTTATWLGAPAIVAAGLVITWRERRLARRAARRLVHEQESGLAPL
ncbi:DMT family transporter [Novosphingobium album (ex Liu et al. 2023)]|uniref:DMT family transporter n=1 Tax=Novosphingobium album (ex Liu et al. 2023) TaxID=3031130 RepID=A0ABT5WW10_9SPHN|nr:DMT family transporter [Novosphingobium album (ex Liu et al. 2023)]MDE8654095.1 DMT family transporter [Novosphingobium album (ex Liu et al. 2023)]